MLNIINSLLKLKTWYL